MKDTQHMSLVAILFITQTVRNTLADSHYEYMLKKHDLASALEMFLTTLKEMHSTKEKKEF